MSMGTGLARSHVGVKVAGKIGAPVGSAKVLADEVNGLGGDRGK